VKETPIFKGPLPEGTDSPDGAAQISVAVEWVEDLLAQIEGLITGAPAPGDLLVVNGTSDPIYRAVTGDVTINSGGVTTIGNEKVVAAMVKNLAITAAKIAEKAVETAKLADLAVTTGKLADLAVTAAKLAAEAVETSKIKNLAVTTAKIALLAVTEGLIADGAVTSRKMKPTVEEKLQTGGDFVLENGMKLVPGLKYQVTPDVTSKLIVDVSLFAMPGTPSSFIEANVYKNGVALIAKNLFYLQAEGRVGHIHHTIVIPLTAAELATIEIKAKMEGVSGKIGDRACNLVPRLYAA